MTEGLAANHLGKLNGHDKTGTLEVSWKYKGEDHAGILNYKARVTD